MRDGLYIGILARDKRNMALKWKWETTLLENNEQNLMRMSHKIQTRWLKWKYKVLAKLKTKW